MTAHLILAGLAITAAAVLVSPTRRCLRGKGQRVTRHRLTNRLMGCPGCRGTGRYYRRGAILVHGFA